MGRQSRAKRERRAQQVEDLRQRERSRLAGERRGCLFCRETDGGFTSQEHVFPESAGNTEVVLPPGVVCDRCNNSVLSQLDQVICDFAPVAMRRSMLGIPSKSGVAPTFRYTEGTLERLPGQDGADPTLIFTSSNQKEILREVERDSSGRVSLKWQGQAGRRLTPRYTAEISRALLKQGMECAWIEHGEVMLESRFDQIRQAILGAPRAGFVAVVKEADPNDLSINARFQLVDYEEGLCRLWVAAGYYGAYALTDSHLPVPVEEMPDLVDVITFSEADFPPSKSAS